MIKFSGLLHLYFNVSGANLLIFRFCLFTGTSTAELNEVEKGIVNEEKEASSHSSNSAVNKYLNEGKVGRVST